MFQGRKSYSSLCDSRGKGGSSFQKGDKGNENGVNTPHALNTMFNAITK
jgi:hypothetical protein